MFKKMAKSTITPQEETQKLIQQLQDKDYNSSDILYEICKRYVTGKEPEPIDYIFFDKGITYISQPENSLLKLFNDHPKNKFSQFFIAKCYTLGLGGVAQCDTTAVKWYQKAANQGLAPAQRNLGVMHQHGKGGLTQSDDEAVKWFQKAANQGLASAQSNLGVMHQQGKGGLTQSDDEAVKWFKKAEDQGFAPAQFNLGIMHEN